MNNSFGTRDALAVEGRAYAIHSLPRFVQTTGLALRSMPFASRVLLENLLRHEDGETVTMADIAAFARLPGADAAEREVAFHPVRVLMPDSSGIPLLVDLAATRDAVADRGLDPRRVNPLIPADLIIDHSVAVDHAGSADALVRNMAVELERNRERYAFVRWAEGQFDNLRVLPPGNGILHQVNVEHLATVVADQMVDGTAWAFPDSLVGTDSHTTMVNGLGVFGWGVGGIEATTALLGEPVGILPPVVVGCRLVGAPRADVLAADIALSLTERLRGTGVLGTVVEFFGPGLDTLPVSDRATVANMAPEYGATMGFFPVDGRTLDFLRQTGRPPERVALVEAYTKRQGLFREPGDEPEYARTIEFDLSSVEPVMAGPARPEARVPLSRVPASFHQAFSSAVGQPPAGAEVLSNGDIVIASITSCTNTSNPRQMLAAGLLARNALARGLRPRPAVKTSLSPGSRVVTSMLERAGLLQPLADLGFDVTGYGCMSCGGMAGPLPQAVTDAVASRNLAVCGVLSSNRNFEGRLHPSVRATYLGSPPLVVAFALAGSVLLDLQHQALGLDREGRPVMLRELWPSSVELDALVESVVTPELFRERYDVPADGGSGWKALPRGTRPVFGWDPSSEYLKRPPFLDDAGQAAGPGEDIVSARALLLLGDDITTDHISPGGPIPSAGAAGRYLAGQGVNQASYDTYIARRANHEVMIRGTFANTRLCNELVPGRPGGLTRHMPDGAEMTIFDAAMAYRAAAVPLVVIAGRNYGCGSSRDWAAKGTRLLGIRAVIAESFERIHRSNLVGMGVLPLQFQPGTTRRTLALTGAEQIDLMGLGAGATPGMTVAAKFLRLDGSVVEVPLTCRVDTAREAEWVRHGGILPCVARSLLAAAEQAEPIPMATAT